MPSVSQYILAPVRFGTRFLGPVKPSDPRMHAFALALQPLVGLAIGAVAALLPLFMAAYFRSLQGLMLFASGVYIFLLEWATRFDHLHGFDAACRVLAGTGISPDDRLERLKQPGSSPCTALLIGLKLLLMYLLFVRTALFSDHMMLVIVLTFVPFIGRIAMLFSYPAKPGEQPGSVGSVVKVFWMLAAMVLTGFVLGLLRTYGGDFFSFRTMKLTMSGFRSTGGNFGGVPPVIAIVSLGIQDMFTFLASGFLTVMYWNTEAAKKLGFSPAPCFAGAVAETAELAAMIVFLLLADDLIF